MQTASTIFLCGDVMTGRCIDQILPFPCDPHIHEPYVRDVRRYVDVAENINGIGVDLEQDDTLILRWHQ